MLAMSDINCIKKLRNEKGLSISEIQRVMKINWRTAKKYADEDQLPQQKEYKRKGMMYEEKWGEIVSDWLFEDSKLKKKSRRTRKQIFEDLREMGFKGSYRTVCYFISDWLTTHQEEKDKGYERLEHPPGEAQVDFGVMEAVQDGEIVDIHSLVMSFPNSNAGFAVPLPAENQECFLHGLNTLFKQVGGVPRKIRIDNLTPAVKKTRSKMEEAQLTDEFIQFQNYYGFDVQVCNPRSGHEKGNVENKVGYVRYNFFTTAPIMNSYEDLTDQIFLKLEADRNRIHYSKNVRIEDLWQEEKKYLLALPEKTYPVFKEQLFKVNKYNEVKVDQMLVHVPRGGNYSQLQLILTWDQLKVVSPNGEILLDDYRPYMKKRKALPWLSIIKTWIQKPRVVEYSRYNKYLPGRIKEFLLVDNLNIRRKRLESLASLLVSYDLKRINEEFYELIAQDKLASESNPYEVDWNKYDSLAPREGAIR
ncbi:transposase [Compostibacillus humi]|uniref:Transposase n=2 Tax=Bacillaceae TaxID=186817 RepID=A0A8J2TQI7_9BACI|nr:IS21 family transposase [Compostibacillus humi]GFZ87002.1 transposase [Compostibacillus humi]